MRLPRFRLPFFWALAAPLLTSTSLLAQGGPALVQLAPIVEREVGEGQTFVGTIVPSRQATIGSAVDGRVVEFPINEGDRVEKKQPLAQLLTATISLEIEAAERERDLHRAELKELETGSRRDEIEQARARRDAAEALAKYRQSQRKRVESLVAQGRAATDQQLEEAISLALEADEQWKEAAAAFRLIEEGPRAERIDQARARELMQKAVVERLHDQRNKYTIISRFAGYVVAEHTEVGAWVSRGDPVAEVIALDEVDIEAKVVEGQVPYVRIGDSVRIGLSALPDRSFIGTVISVVPQADVRSRTFPVKVRVANEFTDDDQPVLKSGMLAQVTLPTGPRRDALLVPKDALVLGGQQRMIWTVDPNSAKPVEESSLLTAPATAVPVELGVADGDLIQVRGDIPPEASVVVLGNERIVPGSDGPTMVQWLPGDESEDRE